MTDFQKFLIGILAGIFIAVLVVVGILFFTKSKTSDSAAADTQILAKIEAEKEELARLQEKIAKKELNLIKYSIYLDILKLSISESKFSEINSKINNKNLINKLK